MTAPPHVNGHARPVTLAPLPVHGAVSGWPQDDPGHARTPADDPGRWRRHVVSAMSAHRGWLAAVPIVLVNAVAFGAQLGFWHVHLPSTVQAALVALALESIAIYLAWQAHLAQLAGDSALRLRLAAYGFALVIGAMNYSHYMAAGWRPTVAAVTFGMMSAVSPWLWSVHSRRVSRDALMVTGDLERHAVRLGMTRWTWHPARSYRVMRLATWEGVTKPADAIALLGDAAPTVRPDGHPHVDKTPPGRRTDADMDRQVDKSGLGGTALDKARTVIRDNPGLAEARAWTALGALAGVSAKTVQRAANGTAETS